MTTATVPANPTTTDRSRVFEREDGGQMHIIGQKPIRDVGVIKLHQVFVNVLYGKDRRLDHLPLHEVPLARRMHRHFGSDLEVLASWVPGVPQAQGMTEEQFLIERERLAGDAKATPPKSPRYLIPVSENQTIDVFAEIYGKGREMSLVPMMRKMYEAWKKLCQACISSQRTATVDEIEAILRIVEPESALDLDGIPGLDEPAMQLPQPGSFAGGIVPAGDVLAPADTGLVDYLVKEKVPDQVAIAFATAVANTPVGMRLSDAQWTEIFTKGPKKADSAARRKALLDMLEVYRGFSEPAPNPV